MKKYYKTELIKSVLYLCWLVVIALLFNGCAGLPTTTKQVFNDYQEVYLRETRPTDKSLDVTVKIRLRAYGNEEEKRREWCRAWPVFCKPHLPTAGMSVSSGTPEIWVDLRQDSTGEVVINDVILGHELRHVLKIYDRRVADPDK